MTDPIMGRVFGEWLFCLPPDHQLHLSNLLQSDTLSCDKAVCRG